MGSDPQGDDGEANSEEEWRFSLEEIRARESGGADAEADDGDGDEGGNITGAFSPAEEVEPGDVDVENALFVVFGVVLSLLAIAGFLNLLP